MCGNISVIPTLEKQRQEDLLELHGKFKADLSYIRASLDGVGRERKKEGKQ